MVLTSAHLAAIRLDPAMLPTYTLPVLRDGFFDTIIDIWGEQWQSKNGC